MIPGERQSSLMARCAVERSGLLNKSARRQGRSGARGVDGCACIFGSLDRLGLSRFRVYVQLSFFPSPVPCRRAFNLRSNSLSRPRLPRELLYAPRRGAHCRAVARPSRARETPEIIVQWAVRAHAPNTMRMDGPGCYCRACSTIGHWLVPRSHALVDARSFYLGLWFIQYGINSFSSSSRFARAKHRGDTPMIRKMSLSVLVSSVMEYSLPCLGRLNQ